MELVQSRPPLSPRSQRLFSLFTNLGDIDEWSLTDTTSVPFSDAILDIIPELPEPFLLTPVSTSAERIQHQVTAQGTKFESNRVSKKNKLSNPRPYSEICFTVSGEPVQEPRRSKFAPARREEVRQIRQRKACLRCSLLKSPCSNGDPCIRCLSNAQKAAGSRVLSWMECVRPSLELTSIFEHVNVNRGQLNFGVTMEKLLSQENVQNVALPFPLNTRSSCTYFARWLTEGTNHSSFHVPRFLRSEEFGQLIQGTFSQHMVRQYRFLLYLTKKVFSRDPRATHRGYNAAILNDLRQNLGNAILKEVQKKLRPDSLKKSNLQDLHALFLVLFGMSWAARYTLLDNVLNGNEISNEEKRKTEAFIRLLSHYLTYIGCVTNLINTSTAQRILATCEFRWDNPRVHTHRLSIDRDSDKFHRLLRDTVQHVPATKASEVFCCVHCGASWEPLDANGLCEYCQFAHCATSGSASSSVELDLDWDGHYSSAAHRSTAELPFWTVFFFHEESFEIYNAITLISLAYRPASTCHQDTIQKVSSSVCPEMSVYDRPQERRHCEACEEPRPRDGG